MHPEKGTKAGEGAGMSSEEWQRALGLFGLERKKLRSALIALHSFLRKGSGLQSVQPPVSEDEHMSTEVQP